LEANALKVGLIGFGRSGTAVASVLLSSPDAFLAWVVRKSSLLQHRSVPELLGVESDEPGLIFPKDEWSAAALLDAHPVDVIIDFSSAEGIYYYGEEAASRGIAIVTAISEYPPEQVEFLRRLSEQTRVFWSPNITLGVNFMMLAARVLQDIAPYADIEIIEEHFKDKRETSGTAKKIASVLGIEVESIKVVRAGGIVGRHEILFGFPCQTVRLIHESISREAFGNGALFAATQVVDKEPGLYSMEDLLMPHFRGIE
jgi:4-hydroxy-tetrahydrodipicolinate reductase